MDWQLETPRLIVRSWRETDLDPYLTLSTDVGYNCFAQPGYYLVRDRAEALEKTEPA